MTQHGDERACPRCRTLLRAEERTGVEGLTYLWRCGCGWAGARTVSQEEGRRERFRSGVIARVVGERRRSVGE